MRLSMEGVGRGVGCQSTHKFERLTCGHRSRPRVNVNGDHRCTNTNLENIKFSLTISIALFSPCPLLPAMLQFCNTYLSNRSISKIDVIDSITVDLFQSSNRSCKDRRSKERIPKPAFAYNIISGPIINRLKHFVFVKIFCSKFQNTCIKVINDDVDKEIQQL